MKIELLKNAFASTVQRKADRLPSEAGMRLRKTPQVPKWKSGIRIPENGMRASWEPFLAKERVA